MVPALGKAGPAMAPIMAEPMRRKLFTVLPGVALLTVSAIGMAVARSL